MAEDHSTTTKHENPIISFFVNLLDSIKLPFPLPAHKKNDDDSHKIDSSPPPPVELVPEPVPVVKEEQYRVPKQTIDYDSLKLEAVGEAPDRTTNPFLLWQVYAIGGFFVMKWAWTRWNERKGPKKPGNEAPPADD